MKWCFLVTYNPFMEFLGKIAHQVVKGGDSCILVYNDKISEYSQKQYFPKEATSFSKVDWCKENYNKEQDNFEDLTWRDFFADFNRFRLFNRGFSRAAESISQKYQFFNFILSKEKPDVVVYEPPSGTSSEIMYRLCQKYGIRYLGLLYAKVAGKIDIRDLKYTSSKYEKTFRELQAIPDEERNFAKKFIEDFLSHNKVPSYVKPEKIYRKELDVFSSYIKKSLKKTPFWVKYFLERKHFKSFDQDSDDQWRMRIRYPFYAIWVRCKKLFQKNIYSSPGEQDEYFIFPLQNQPEASTLVLSTYYYDLVNTVKNIAFALPFPYKLYVKEHPQAKGDRPLGFYKKIKQIPNVVLLSPFEVVDNLIERSKGVVALTSTVGLEAALTGKPVYILGNALYSYHPMCRKLDGFTELEEKIKEDLAGNPMLSNLEEINIRFIVSYFKNIIDGDIGLVLNNGKIDTNDYGKIYQDIKRLFLQ